MRRSLRCTTTCAETNPSYVTNRNLRMRVETVERAELDARGTALANYLAGYQAGIRVFDGSTAGVGLFASSASTLSPLTSSYSAVMSAVGSYRSSGATDIGAGLMVKTLGGGAGLIPAAADDEATINRILAYGGEALPALIRGLKYPPGFAAKRASILAAMQRLADKRAAAFALPTLRHAHYTPLEAAAALLSRSCV